MTLLAFLLPNGSAGQGEAAIQHAADVLRNDPVYVHPRAETSISAADADAIRRRIEQSGAAPMYVAILPASAGPARAAGRELEQQLGLPGTYAVVAGNQFRADSTDLPGVQQQATAAFQAHGGEGAAAVLEDFASRVGRLRAGEQPGSGGGIGSGVILVPLVLLGGGALLVRDRRRRKAEEAELAELKANVRDDLVALGDDIRALDLDMEMPGANPAAKADYDRAVQRYQVAEERWETARHPDDFEPVGAALEEGRFAMASAKARLNGEPVPERTPPCFFDPRHGPSSREVEWAPYGGAPRLVPACEADAQRVERGEDPEAREVLVGGQRMPYWNAGPMCAPFAGGFFGGGLLPASPSAPCSAVRSGTCRPSTPTTAGEAGTSGAAATSGAAGTSEGAATSRFAPPGGTRAPRRAPPFSRGTRTPAA